MSDSTDLLRAIPERWAHPPSEHIAQINRGRGVVLDYLGHADTTLALIEVDPTWTYDYHRAEDGNMDIRTVGKRFVLEGALTVHGVTRPCVGTCDANKGEPEKELLGDLIRNGAMRFGIATGLWSKADAQGGYVPDARHTDEPDPVADLFAKTKTLDDDQKEALRLFAGDRSVKADDLRANPEWLTELTEMVDELLTEAKTEPSDPDAKVEVADDGRLIHPDGTIEEGF